MFEFLCINLNLYRWWKSGIALNKSEVPSAVGDRLTAVRSLEKPLGENVNNIPVSEGLGFKNQAW